MRNGDKGDEHNEIEFSAIEAKIAAKLFLRSELLREGGCSQKYFASKAELMVKSEYKKLIKRVTKDFKDEPILMHFDDCILRAKDIVAERKGKRS